VTDKIRVDLLPPVCEIVLNQPEKRNALSQDMWAAIPGIISNAVANENVKVIILHGGTSGAFAAGADISEFSTVYSTQEAARQSGEIIASALSAIETCEKPVIAAIEGACVGGGVSLAMAADLRIASTGALFGVTPGKLGLVYPAADTRRLIEAIGLAATKDLLYTGRLIKSDEAVRIRLIERTAQAGEVLAAARLWAKEVASISQWSVRATKQMIRGVQTGWSDNDASAEALFLAGFSNDDFKEGYRAFLDKRSPVWKIR
jgi:enoyl-CoA hydratase/carnithine racemase